jgi:hypothetical protein
VESRTFLYNQLRYEKSDRNHTKGVEGIATLGPLVREHHLMKDTFSEPLLSTN